MATIQQNNINFTNVKSDPIFAAIGKFSKSGNDDGTAHFDTSLSGDEIAKSFNSIEIDWNGAEIDENTTINTTGELLSYVKEKSSISVDAENHNLSID